MKIRHQCTLRRALKSWALFLFLWLYACGTEEAPQTVVTPIETPRPSSTDWQNIGEIPVAQLGNHTFTLESLKSVLAGSDIKNPQVLLNDMLAADAVASKAINEQNGVLRASTVQRYRQALVQSYLKKKLEIELNPATVPNHYIEVSYNRMRPFFDHFDAYYVMDFLLLCCRESPGYCAENAARFDDCFKSLKTRSELIYDLVSKAEPKSPEEFEGLFSAVQIAVGQDLKFQDYSMFYDSKRTWEEMTDMNRLTKPVTEQIITMSVGEISKPTRDIFGWHVLFLKKFNPEIHRKVDDQDVRLEIGEKIISSVRQSEYTKLIQRSGSARKVQLHFERLNVIINSMNTAK